MKNALFFLLLIFIVSCSNVEKKEPTKDQPQKETKPTIEIQRTDTATKALSVLPVFNLIDTLNTKFIASNFDDSDFEVYTKSTKKKIQSLAEDSVFIKRHSLLSKELDSNHIKHFESQHQSILSFTSGSLFNESSNDFAFIIFDPQMNRVSLTVFDEVLNQYFEMYREMKVINDLKETECGGYLRQTLDNMVAGDIVSLEEYLIERPESYTTYPKIKIVNVLIDSDILPEYGCISDDSLVRERFNSLCFATSIPYNNWQCLIYDSVNNCLRLYYNQEFAD